MRNVLVPIMLAVASAGFGQTVERNSSALPVVSDAYATLTAVTGWSKNHLDQWIQQPNSIPYRSKMAFELSQFTDRNLGADNFVRLELRKVTIDGKTFPLLAIYRKVGSYLYPAIKEKWTERTDCRAFVFKNWPTILDSAKEENKAVKLTFPLHTFAEVQFTEVAGDVKAKLVAEVQTSIKMGALYDEKGEAMIDLSKAGEKGAEGLPKMKSKAAFNLLVFPVTYEGKQSVRFLFDYKMVMSEFADLNMFAREGETGALFDEGIGSDLTEFEKWYFEVPRQAFVDFWNAKMPA